MQSMQFLLDFISFVGTYSAKSETQPQLQATETEPQLQALLQALISDYRSCPDL